MSRKFAFKLGASAIGGLAAGCALALALAYSTSLLHLGILAVIVVGVYKLAGRKLKAATTSTSIPKLKNSSSAE